MDVEIRFEGDARDAQSAAIDIDKALEQIAAVAEQVSRALGGIEIKPGSVAAIQTASASIKSALDGVVSKALEASGALGDVRMDAGQAAGVAADAAVISAALDGVTASARRARDEVRDVSGPSARTMVGAFAAGVPFSDQARFSAGQGGAPGTDLIPYSVAQLLLQNRAFALPGQYAQTGRRDVGRTLGQNDPATMSAGEIAAMTYLASRGGGGGGGGGDIAALLGFGAGASGGIPIPGFGRFGLGTRRFGGGLAGFGTLGGLAGFGAERALTSTLGIGGSMLGGLGGGALAGLGVLGPTVVGMGTDMAGIGQAAGDTKAVSQSLTNLTNQIGLYGKGSREAALAQAQLNQTLAGFSPVARQAVLAAAQQSQSFKTLFDQMTGGAEKIGAEIINQGIGTGKSFLPTIGKFAQQNMGIIQQGMQPLMSWLQGSGATQGLGIFTDLEKMFQSRLPTSVHVGSQAFEVFANLVDDAAHQVGTFMTKIDAFLTKVNTPAGLASMNTTVTNLIGLFKTWANLLGSLGAMVYDLFKPAVGLGQDFARQLTGIVNLIRQWLSAAGTKDVLRNLFAAHKAQMDAIFGVLRSMLPALEQVTSSFMQVEAAVARISIGPFQQLASLIQDISRIPFATTVAGWLAALFLMRSAGIAVFSRLTGQVRGVLGTIGLMAPATSTASKEMTAAMEPVVAELKLMNAQFLGTGAAAKEGEVGVVTAMTGIERATAAATGFVDTLKVSLLSMAGMVIPIAIALSIIPPNNVGQNVLDKLGLGGLGKVPLLGHVAQWSADAGNKLRGVLGESNLNQPNTATGVGDTPPAGYEAGTYGMGMSTPANPGGYLTNAQLIQRGLQPGSYGQANSTRANPGGFAGVALMTAAQRRAMDAKYGIAAPLPTGIPPLSSFGGGGGSGAVPALVPGNTALAQAQQAYLAATGPGSTRTQQIAAAKDYLAELKKIQTTDEAIQESGKKNLTVQRELVTIARQINVAKGEIRGPQAALGSINAASRSGQGVLAQIAKLMGPAGPLVGGQQPTDPSELLQLPTVAQVQAKLSPMVSTWKSQIANFSRELKDHLISADSVTTIENRIDQIKTKVANALASMKTTAQQQASAFKSIWQSYVQSFDDTFNQQTQDILAHPENYPAILPISAALADLQDQHTQQQLQQALSDAQDQLAQALSGANNSSSILATAQKKLSQDAMAHALDVAQSKLLGGKPADMTDKILRDMRQALSSSAPDANAVKQAQRAVANAEYDIKVNSLSKQASAEQTAYQNSRTLLKQHLDQSLGLWGDFYANAGKTGFEAITLLNQLLVNFGFQPIANPFGANPFPGPLADPQTVSSHSSGQITLPSPGSVVPFAKGGLITSPHFLVDAHGMVKGMVGEGGGELIVPVHSLGPQPWNASHTPIGYQGETHVHVQFADGMEWLSQFVDVRVMKNAPAISKKIGRDADHRIRGRRF